jgi:two-component system, cell cycle response regulator DivK
MDLEMPVVGGWEATRQLKSSPQTSDIPIIGLSAHAMAGEREKAIAAGCNVRSHRSNPIVWSQQFGACSPAAK